MSGQLEQLITFLWDIGMKQTDLRLDLSACRTRKRILLDEME